MNFCEFLNLSRDPKPDNKVYFMGELVEFNKNINVKGGYVKRLGRLFFRKNHNRIVKGYMKNYPVNPQFLPKLAQNTRYFPNLPNISKSEVKLMVDYLNDGYRRFPYDSYNLTDLDRTINNGIEFVLKKLPKPDIKPSTVFTRYIRVPDDDVDSFIESYLVGSKVTFNGKPRKYAIDGEILDSPRYINNDGILKLKSPMSFSKSAKHASFFKNKNKIGRTLIKYEVQPSRNTKSKDVEMFKLHTHINEGEMLFPHKSKFKVVDVSEAYSRKDDESFYRIKLKEL